MIILDFIYNSVPLLRIHYINIEYDKTQYRRREKASFSETYRYYTFFITLFISVPLELGQVKYKIKHPPILKRD